MRDFITWCEDNDLAEIVCGKKLTSTSGKKADHKEKVSGGRDGCDDLSKDYKGHMAQNGTVEPCEVAKKKKKAKPKG